MEYFVYRCAFFFSRILPLKFAYWVGLRIADVYYLFDRAGRSGVRSNLRRIHAWRGIRPSEKTLTGMTRKTYQYFGKYLVDFFRFGLRDAHELKRVVSIQHMENLERARARGCGVILATAHFGNWELGAAVMGAMDYQIHAVVRPTRRGRLNQLFRKQRERRGIHVIPIGRAVREVIKQLERGELVALLADRDFTSGHHPRPFFGAPAPMPAGPARIAMKTGAAVVPAFLTRRIDDTYLLRFDRPIYPDEAGSAAEIQRRLVSVLEEEIAQQPYQWFIFHDYWAGEQGNESTGTARSGQGTPA